MCWGWNLAEQMTNENEIFFKIDFREKRCGKIDQSVWRAEKIDRLEWRNDKSGQSECTGLEIIFCQRAIHSEIDSSNMNKMIENVHSTEVAHQPSHPIGSIEIMRWQRFKCYS